MNKGFCLWLMGLSASGKTTLARLLLQELERRGFQVEVLDGDQVRSNLSRDLGFTPRDRETNLRRIALVTRLLVRHGVVVVVAAICPYENMRREVRAEIGEFVEVYLDCPLEVCIRRDPKGLYRRALAGEIEHFTGLDDPFETPARPEIVVRTDTETPRESLRRILAVLEAKGIIPGL
jgi:adenylyl-sulfate kinase